MRKCKEIEFTCPKCNEHRIEEIMVDVGVISEISRLLRYENGVGIEYGEQTNDDGHVDRYQCGGCGYTIVSDAPEFDELTMDGLDENALVKAIDELNSIPVKAKELELISVDELANRFSKLIREGLSGEDLATFWNTLVDEKIVYEGDSMFRMMKE